MKRSLILLLPACLLLLSGCEMFKMKGPFKPYDAAAVLPDDFLYTKYAPLNKWLDTPVRIQVYDTPLSEVFDHPALEGLNLQLVEPLRENPRINMERIAITRRQFLWCISHDHELSMSPIFGPRGETSYIAVRPKPQVH